MTRRLLDWFIRSAIGVHPDAVNSNLAGHARNELRAVGLWDSPDVMDRVLANDIMMMVGAFAIQNHSGMTAQISIVTLFDLLRYKPLAPLTGEDWEWVEAGATPNGDPLFQNKRCSAVFREPSPDGTGWINYWIDGIVFRTPDGATYTRQPQSRTYIAKFPWRVPEKPQIVDVDEEGEEPDAIHH